MNLLEHIYVLGSVYFHLYFLTFFQLVVLSFLVVQKYTVLIMHLKLCINNSNKELTWARAWSSCSSAMTRVSCSLVLRAATQEKWRYMVVAPWHSTSSEIAPAKSPAISSSCIRLSVSCCNNQIQSLGKRHIYKFVKYYSLYQTRLKTTISILLLFYLLQEHCLTYYYLNNITKIINCLL